jgi:hypothetical protein
LEIWVTNKQNRVVATNNNLRNIICYKIWEAQLSGLADNEVVVLDPIPASPPFFTAGLDTRATIKTMLITLS